MTEGEEFILIFFLSSVAMSYLWWEMAVMNVKSRGGWLKARQEKGKVKEDKEIEAKEGKGKEFWEKK